MLTSLLLLAQAAVAAVASSPVTRVDLTASELTGEWAYPRLVAYAAYAPPASGAHPDPLQGRLTLRPRRAAAHLAVHRDDYRETESATSQVGVLPVIVIDVVQDGGVIIPARRAVIASGHPHWDYALGTGRAWREPGDQGYSRASIPFALVEKNANCVHNGVVTFLYRPDGRTSRAAYQLSGETCAYFKADLWGVAEVSYVPGLVRGGDGIVTEWRHEQAARLPTRAIGELAVRYPGTRVTAFGNPEDVRDLTTWGVVVDGVHYAGSCPTRAGGYPYCDQVLLPSYSLAKSLFAALALMRLERLYPGAKDARVADLVPECRASGRWNDVALVNLLDMTTGNYLSADDQVDEASPAVDAGFFLAVSNADKLRYACDAYPRSGTPGQRFVYHTTDTYLLGVAMTALLRRKRGPDTDIVGDLAWPDLWREMGLPARVSVVRRTGGLVAQPFVGYGLLLEPADVARMTAYFVDGNPLPAKQLDVRMYEAALQHDPASRGMPVPGAPSLLYQHGFWALRVDGLPSCDQAVYVPFMSGYGGLTVALMPNGVAYYYFSDGGDFHFLRAVRESANIHPYCTGVAGHAAGEEPGS